MYSFKQVYVTAFLGAGISIAMGLYRLFVYADPDVLWTEGLNRHVSDDAYNLIINSNQATAFFALALVGVVIGMGAKIIQSIEKTNSSVIEEDKKEAIKKQAESESI